MAVRRTIRARLLALSPASAIGAGAASTTSTPLAAIDPVFLTVSLNRTRRPTRATRGNVLTILSWVEGGGSGGVGCWARASTTSPSFSA
jgi:hypothetical protein